MRTKTLLSTAALVFVVAVTPALAESRPHKMSGSGQFTSATDFASKGIATHLGSFTETGSVQFSGTDDPFVLQIDGWAIHTAANGDQVYELISGQLNLATGAGTATTTYVGGTGRFADATGSSTISLQLTGPGSYVFSGEGTIDY
jgi:hypothetical protein